MPLATESVPQSAPALQLVHNILGRDPLRALAELEAAAQSAAAADDNLSHTLICASALGFMLADWSRFPDWSGWDARFAARDAVLPSGDDNDAALVRATGALASALLRGDETEALKPLGLRLQALIGLVSDAPMMSTQIALAAAALLPWLQMSCDVAGAQALHAHMTALADRQRRQTDGAYYLRGLWLTAWAQYLHSVDRVRLPDALHALDHAVESGRLPLLRFRRARLATEKALHDQNSAAVERGLRDMLATLHPERPMESAIYNVMALTVAASREDIDAALLHMEHMNRALALAECPPSVANVYRMREGSVHVRNRDYEKAAATYEQCALAVHTSHGMVIRGYAALARALLIEQQDDIGARRDALREQLSSGLAAMRRLPSPNFLYATLEARGAVCALALREGIETTFVRAALEIVPAPPPAWADEQWPWAMSLRCFAGFRSDAQFAEGQSASKASSRVLKLLMLIAAHGVQGVPVSVATDALWPDQDADQAESAIGVTLLRLRRLHAETDLIERRNGWLHLNAHRVWTDVMALEAHLEVPPDISASPSQRGKYINRLFDLYRGDCLFGVDDEWARSRAAHYRGRITAATRQIVIAALSDGDDTSSELALTRAHEAGADVARLLATGAPVQVAGASWDRLRRHVGMLAMK